MLPVLVFGMVETVGSVKETVSGTRIRTRTKIATGRDRGAVAVFNITIYRARMQVTTKSFHLHGYASGT